MCYQAMKIHGGEKEEEKQKIHGGTLNAYC